MPKIKYTPEQRSLAKALCNRGLNSSLIGKLIGMKPDQVRAIKAGRVKAMNWSTPLSPEISATAIRIIQSNT